MNRSTAHGGIFRNHGAVVIAMNHSRGVIQQDLLHIPHDLAAGVIVKSNLQFFIQLVVFNNLIRANK